VKNTRKFGRKEIVSISVFSRCWCERKKEVKKRMGSANTRRVPDQDTKNHIDFVIPTFHPSMEVEKEIYIQGFPQVDGTLVFQMRNADIFDPIRALLNVDTLYDKTYAVVKTITSKVIVNTTGCDISIRIENPFDLQEESWLSEGIHFSHVASKPDKVDKGLEMEEGEKSEEEKEGEEKSEREKFNQRVYGGVWNEQMDPNETKKNSVTLWVPQTPTDKEELVYQCAISNTLKNEFGLTEASLCQVTWSQNGDVVSYNKEHYMASWFKSPVIQARMNMSARQVVEEDDMVKIPKEFYHKANIMMMEGIISELHYTQFRQTKIVYTPINADQESRLVKKIRDSYEECETKLEKVRNAVINYNVVIKLVVAAVIGSKMDGAKMVCTRDGVSWI
jgi:hypothetical protein